MLTCETQAQYETSPSPAPTSLPLRSSPLAPTRIQLRITDGKVLAHPWSRTSIRSWQVNRVIKENLTHSRIKVINYTRTNNLTEVPMSQLNLVAISNTSESASKRTAKS